MLTDDNANGDRGRDALMGETLGMGIIDCGCVDTVCGQNWLRIYIETLSKSDRKQVFSQPSSARYRFGPGPIYQSKEQVHLPVHIGSTFATLAVNVVSCDVPLLISRKSLQKAESVLDLRIP